VFPLFYSKNRRNAMSYNKYTAQSNDPLFAYIGQKLKGMRGYEFSIIIESESKIYMKEYGEGDDDEEWEEGTEPFTINGKMVFRASSVVEQATSPAG
jgi:hypothetical protein